MKKSIGIGSQLSQITGVYLRIINVEKFKERTRLLKQLYKFVKINPNLVVPSPIYKISQFLLSKKLIYIWQIVIWLF